LKTFRLAISVCFSFFVTAAVCAQMPPTGSSLTVNPVLQKSCVKCHGKTAEGRRFAGPSLVSGKAATMSADDLRNIITNGRGRMPKFAGKLTSEEIDVLVQQISVSRK